MRETERFTAWTEDGVHKAEFVVYQESIQADSLTGPSKVLKGRMKEIRAADGHDVITQDGVNLEILNGPYPPGTIFRRETDSPKS